MPTAQRICQWFDAYGISAEIGKQAGTIRIADTWTFRLVACPPDMPLTAKQKAMQGTDGIMLHHRGTIHFMIVPIEAYRDMMAAWLRVETGEIACIF